MAKGKKIVNKKKTTANELATRDFTINLHKRLFGVYVPPRFRGLHALTLTATHYPGCTAVPGTTARAGAAAAAPRCAFLSSFLSPLTHPPALPSVPPLSLLAVAARSVLPALSARSRLSCSSRWALPTFVSTPP